MARGKKCGRFKNSKKFNKKRKKNYDNRGSLSQKRGSRYGDEDSHAAVDIGRGKRRKISDNILITANEDDNSSEEEENHFKKLLTSFSTGYYSTQKKSVESGTSSEDETEEETKNSVRENDISSSDSVSDIENESIASDEEEIDDTLDPFVCHFHYDLDTGFLDTLGKRPRCLEKTRQSWPVLGQISIDIPKVETCHSVEIKPRITLEGEKQFANPGTIPQRITNVNWSQLHVKSQIENNISKANVKNLTMIENPNVDCLTPLQKEIFSITKNYQDLYYPDRNLKNGEEIRFMYCLHAVNHILKTRIKILHHNQKLQHKEDVPEDFRDQGLVRPKVVILVPFKESALR